MFYVDMVLNTSGGVRVHTIYNTHNMSVVCRSNLENNPKVPRCSLRANIYLVDIQREFYL